MIFFGILSEPVSFDQMYFVTQSSWYFITHSTCVFFPPIITYMYVHFFDEQVMKLYNNVVIENKGVYAFFSESFGKKIWQLNALINM